jgi:hypothetical protein
MPHVALPLTLAVTSTLASSALSPSLARAGSERPRFPLKASVDGRWLVDETDRPILYQADTAWKLFVRLDLAEAEEYLRERKNQGFTAVQVMLTGFLDDRSRAGHLPFDGEHDLTRPNEAYFAHVDAVVAKAGELGLALAIAPLWAGCCGEGWAGKSKDGRPKPLDVQGPGKARAFGRWLGARYGKHPQVLWILGGDNDPRGTRASIEALAQGLKEAAPRQLVTYHAASSHSSTDPWPEARWLDVSMIYTYFRGFNRAWNKAQPDAYEEATRERSKRPARPFFLGESTYEDEHGDWGSARQARRQAYWAVLGGASGHAYGSPNWKLEGDWRATVHLPGAESLRHLHLLTVRPFHALVPDDANQVAVDGRGSFASNDYATTARSADGRFEVSYPRTLVLDLGKVAGRRVRAQWFDPRTGIVTPGGAFAARGRRAFAPPGDEDWVLVLDDADAGLPSLGASLGKDARLSSVDHRGHCRRGTPSIDGETKALPGGGIALTAHGSEYGHHCGPTRSTSTCATPARPGSAASRRAPSSTATSTASTATCSRAITPTSGYVCNARASASRRSSARTARTGVSPARPPSTSSCLRSCTWAWRSRPPPRAPSMRARPLFFATCGGCPIRQRRADGAARRAGRRGR